MFFFGTRLWQSVTMLIGGIRYSVKANNQTENIIEITLDLLPSRSGVVTE